MSKDFFTRTFTNVEVTTTVMNKGTKSLETITVKLPAEKDEAVLEKKLRKICEEKDLVFCTIEKKETKTERRRMTVEKFIENSELF